MVALCIVDLVTVASMVNFVSIVICSFRDYAIVLSTQLDPPNPSVFYKRHTMYSKDEIAPPLLCENLAMNEHTQ